MKGFTPLAILIGLASLLCIISLYNKTAHADSDPSCRPIEIIFARGSGEDPNDREFTRLKDQINLRIKPSSIYNLSELGEKKGDQYYPATTVDRWWENGNAIGAGFSAGYGNDYGESVKTGVNELIHYISDKSHDCPSSQFVLSGYSQGAQVIGQYLNLLNSQEYSWLRSRIIYVALFGDPKLHLPEGEGIFPPACRGEQLSAYRRDIANCRVDNGSLGARKPYLPLDMHNKTGLWCNDVDFVCGSAKVFWHDSGHSQYDVGGGPIDKAVKEMATRIKASMPTDLSQYINIASKPDKDLDLLFLVSEKSIRSGAPLAGDSLPSITSFLGSSDQRIKNMNGKTGLTTAFLTMCVDFPLAPISNVQTSEWYLLPAPPIGVDKQFEITLKCALDHQEWRPEAEKHIIIIDTGGFSEGRGILNAPIESISSLIDRLRPLNPRIHILTPAMHHEPFRQLIQEFNGNMTNISESGTFLAPQARAISSINSTSQEADINNILDSILSEAEGSLEANLAIADYQAPPGTALTFDASRSISDNDPIIKYQWDFNDDGSVDETTASPVVRHTYNQNYTGTMRVTVVTQQGRTASTTASIRIGSQSQTVRIPAPQLTVTKDEGSSVTIQWSSTSTSVAGWVIAMNDIPLGMADASKTTTTITDLIRNEDITISVTAISSGEELGLPATITLLKRGSSASSTEAPDVSGQRKQGKPSPSPAESNQTNESDQVSPSEMAVNQQNSASQPPKEKTSPNQNYIILFILIGAILVTGGGICTAIQYRARHRNKAPD